MKKAKGNNQLVIIGALAAVLLAVGAFQFMGPGPAPAPVASSEPAAPAAQPVAPDTASSPAESKDPVREQLMELMQATATPRDPFQPSGEIAQDMAAAQPGKIVNAATPAPERPQPSGPRGGRRTASAPEMAPWNPLPGGLPAQGGLQPVRGEIGGRAGNSAGAPTESSYKVKGIIVGNRKMAVFEDESGNQKLVALGGSVDSDTTVVGISDGVVRLRKGGQVKEVRIVEENR